MAVSTHRRHARRSVCFSAKQHKQQGQRTQTHTQSLSQLSEHPAPYVLPFSLAAKEQRKEKEKKNVWPGLQLIVTNDCLISSLVWHFTACLLESEQFT